MRKIWGFHTRWFGICLKVIEQPDVPQIPHDHPWWFWRVVLAGSFLEHVRPNKDNQGWVLARWRDPGTMGTIRRSAAHVITRVERPVLVLIVSGRDHGGWGFWPGGRFIAWQDYLAQPQPVRRPSGGQPWDTVISMPAIREDPDE